MKTWTCNNFIGHYPVGVGAVVTAETVELACLKLEIQLAEYNLPQIIKPEQLILLPTGQRYVRILTDGMY